MKTNWRKTRPKWSFNDRIKSFDIIDINDLISNWTLTKFGK